MRATPPSLDVFGYTKDGEHYEIAFRSEITAEFAALLAKRYERLGAVLNWAEGERTSTNQIPTSLLRPPLPRIIENLHRKQNCRSTRRNRDRGDGDCPSERKPRSGSSQPLHRASRKQSKPFGGSSEKITGKQARKGRAK